MIAKAPPFRFTVDQYDQMIETGILTEDNRVELIRGEIVPKMPSGPRHAAIIKRLIRLLGPQIQGRATWTPRIRSTLRIANPSRI